MLNRLIAYLFGSIALLCTSLEAASSHFTRSNSSDAPDASPQEENTVIAKTDEFEAVIYQGVGYRYDRQESKIYYFGDSSILNTVNTLKGRNTVETILGLDLSYKNWFLNLRGDYGWLVNGVQDVVNPGNNVDEPTAFKNFSLGSGYTADAQVTSGYDIRLVKTENFRFGLVPAVGYKYWHMMNWREGEKRFTLPVPPVVLPPVLTGFALDRQQSPDQQDWFGVYVQGGLTFQWTDKAKLALFYQYHFMDMREKMSAATDIYAFFPADVLVSQQMYRFDIRSYSNHVYAQVGGLDFAYWVNANLCWGVQFEGSRLWSNRATTKIKTVKEEFVLAPVGITETTTYSKTTLSWTSYRADVYLGYAF